MARPGALLTGRSPSILHQRPDELSFDFAKSSRDFRGADIEFVRERVETDGLWPVVVATLDRKSGGAHDGALLTLELTEAMGSDDAAGAA